MKYEQMFTYAALTDKLKAMAKPDVVKSKGWIAQPAAKKWQCSCSLGPAAKPVNTLPVNPLAVQPAGWENNLQPASGLRVIMSDPLSNIA